MLFEVRVGRGTARRSHREVLRALLGECHLLQCDAVVWMDECFVDDETGDCLCEACEKKEESK